MRYSVSHRAFVLFGLLWCSSWYPCATGQSVKPTKIKTERPTGQFTSYIDRTGDLFGYTIIIYQGPSYWAVAQEINEQEMPAVCVPATVHGTSIEFTIPTESGPNNFRGIVRNGYLVGEFSNPSMKVKLKRVAL
jgi:hypothetical protein